MKKYIVFLIVGFALVFAYSLNGVNETAAQSGGSETLITWQTNTYVPEGFPGKIMPSADAEILAGVDLIESGRKIDLTPYKIYWYVDGKFYQGAPGLTRISLKAPHLIGDSKISLRVLISDYRNGVGKTVVIPVVTPQVVIQSSAPSLSAAEAPFKLQAYPFFFNINHPSELNYEWDLAGTIVSNENPFTASRELAERGLSRMELSVSNPNRPIERIVETLSIFR